ncbi:MAG: hypothetical protein H5T86_02245 [Armatimonadetes bacterium]|nr:hypothetical protein [Armatimonadota bacterium]
MLPLGSPEAQRKRRCYRTGRQAWSRRKIGGCVLLVSEGIELLKCGLSALGHTRKLLEEASPDFWETV